LNRLELVKQQLEKWYPHIYHKLYVDGEIYQAPEGKMCRDVLDRVNKININPYKKRMLDIGSNMGGIAWAYRMYYSEYIGIERNSENVDFCENLKHVYEVQGKTRFFNYNLHNGMDHFNYLGNFDIIFLLSMTQHLKNIHDIIKWCDEHCNLLVIEYNGQPQDIERFKRYTKEFRKIVDMDCQDGYRFTYLAYRPIEFIIEGETYQGYKFSQGKNCYVYRDPERDVVIKVYKNDDYKKGLKINSKLKCIPDIVWCDEKKKIVVQKFAGSKLCYYNAPVDYVDQIEKIKDEIKSYEYDGVDSQLFVKDGKLSLIDVGAWQKTGVLNKTYDVQIKNVGMRKDQFFNGGILNGKAEE
jgi:hypothetical protein